MLAQELDIAKGALLDVVAQDVPQVRVHRAGVGVIQSPRRHADVVGDCAQLRLLSGQRLQRDAQTVFVAG